MKAYLMMKAYLNVINGNNKLYNIYDSNLVLVSKTKETTWM